MTIDELKAAAKLRTRKMSTDELDEDVFRYVDFATGRPEKNRCRGRIPESPGRSVDN